MSDRPSPSLPSNSLLSDSHSQQCATCNRNVCICYATDEFHTVHSYSDPDVSGTEHYGDIQDESSSMSSSVARPAPGIMEAGPRVSHYDYVGSVGMSECSSGSTTYCGSTADWVDPMLVDHDFQGYHFGNNQREVGAGVADISSSRTGGSMGLASCLSGPEHDSGPKGNMLGSTGFEHTGFEVSYNEDGFGYVVPVPDDNAVGGIDQNLDAGVPDLRGGRVESWEDLLGEYFLCLLGCGSKHRFRDRKPFEGKSVV